MRLGIRCPTIELLKYTKISAVIFVSHLASILVYIFSIDLGMRSKRTGADSIMASKNNPSRRNRQQQEKMFDGKKVKPGLYVGSHVGHGRYMATQEEGGKLVTDKSGKPVPYSQV